MGERASECSKYGHFLVFYPTVVNDALINVKFGVEEHTAGLSNSSMDPREIWFR